MPYISGLRRKSTRHALCCLATLLPSFCFVACTSHPPAKTTVHYSAADERMAEMTSKIERQDDEITRLEAKLELLTHRLRETRSDKKKSVDKRVIETPRAAAARAEDDKASNDEESGKTLEENTEDDSLPEDFDDEATVADSTNESMHLYYQGIQNRENGRLEEALKSFRDFLRMNPAHVYADRAEFNIAETHFRNKEYGLVLVSTALLETKFPHSLVLPEALFRKGLSYEALGQWDAANATFRTILRKFPGSSLVAAAEKKISPKKFSAPPLMPPSNLEGRR